MLEVCYGLSASSKLVCEDVLINAIRPLVVQLLKHKRYFYQVLCYCVFFLFETVLIFIILVKMKPNSEISCVVLGNLSI